MDKFNGKSLLLLGDSIMYGSGNGGFGVGEYLKRDFGFKLHKYAVGGARVGYVEGKNWIVEQVRKAVSDGVNADYIILDGFTNDCCLSSDGKCDVPLGNFRSGYDGYDIFKVSKERTFSECLDEIMCALRTHFKNAKILFVRPHKMGRRDGELQKIYGERAVEICKKWGAYVADLYNDCKLDTFLPEHRDRYTFDSYNQGRGDCTHPNALGYEEMYMPLIESKLKSL